MLVHTDTISFYTIHNTVKNTPEVNTLYRTLGHVSCVPICGLLNLNHQHYRHMSEFLSCNNVQCCITFHQPNTGSRQLCSSNHWQSSWRLWMKPSSSQQSNKQECELQLNICTVFSFNADLNANQLNQFLTQLTEWYLLTIHTMKP